MKRIILIAIVGTFFMVSGWTLTGVCGVNEDANPSLIYGAFLDEYVQKCEAKAKLLDSGSFNIRKNAMKSTLKGALIKSNRDTMIDYLVEKKVPHNIDRVEYHLTRKYTESVHPQKLYAMLLKDYVTR